MDRSKRIRRILVSFNERTEARAELFYEIIRYEELFIYFRELLKRVPDEHLSYALSRLLDGWIDWWVEDGLGFEMNRSEVVKQVGRYTKFLTYADQRRWVEYME